MRFRWGTGFKWKWLIYLALFSALCVFILHSEDKESKNEVIQKLKHENEILKMQIENASFMSNFTFSPALINSVEGSKIPVEPFLNVLTHLQSMQTNYPNMSLNPIYLAKNQNILRSMGRLVIGIPTVKRSKKSYLLETIRTCLTNVRPEEASLVTFVVFIAERKFDSDINETVQAIQSEFNEAIGNGILEVIMPPSFWYPPDLDYVEPTFGDSQERMIWRTKQNLDYAYLMVYAYYFYGHIDYYVQLEDDVISKFGYVSAMTLFADNNENWFGCDFSKLGFIAKLFKIKDLPLLSNFILLFYREKPVDWILDQLYIVRYCNHEKSGCIKNLINGVRRLYHKPPLFQHIGRFSSLSGKVQLLKESAFKLKSVAAAPIPHSRNFEADQLSSQFSTFTADALAQFYNYSTPLVLIFNQTDESPNVAFKERELFRIDWHNPIAISSIGFRYSAHYDQLVGSSLPFQLNLCLDTLCSDVKFPYILYPKIQYKKPQNVSSISIIFDNASNVSSFSLDALLIA